MKKVSLEWPSHMFVVLQSLQDFTYIAFMVLLCGSCIVLAIHHIESNSFETFYASSNHCLFMRKLTFGPLCCTTEWLLEIACDSNILPFLFSPWIFESFISPTKWLESFHKCPKLLSLMKKVSLEWASHIFVVLQSLQDFTYIAFKELLCGNSIVLAIHHIESNWFETFHTSSNHCLFMRKLTLGHLWCTTERLLEIAYDSKILPLSFLSLNFWKFQKSNKIAWNFAQMTEAVVVDEKKLIWSSIHTSLWFCRLSKISPI